jgi:hypothetical protein
VHVPAPLLLKVEPPKDHRCDLGLLMGAAGSVASLIAVALVDFPFHRIEECFLFWTLIGLVSLTSSSDRKPA